MPGSLSKKLPLSVGDKGGARGSKAGHALQLDMVDGHLTFGMSTTCAWDGLPLTVLSNVILNHSLCSSSSLTSLPVVGCFLLIAFRDGLKYTHKHTKHTHTEADW